MEAAIANILFGEVNPSGKLPLTFPKSVNDLPRPQIPFFPQETPVTLNVNYSEGFLVGYKWYQAKNIEPLFPFGYGLSYSTFSFANLNVRRDERSRDKHTVHVSFDVTNTSGRGGSEVAQVYLALPANANEAPKRLVSWQKVYLEPRQTRRVELEIESEASSHPLSIWDANNNAWEILKGEYTVFVGDSSGDSKLTGGFSVGGH